HRSSFFFSRRRRHTRLVSDWSSDVCSSNLVSFGLVSIPVKLYSATEASKAISFNLLHKTCGSRLKQQYLCIKEEVVVPREDMTRSEERRVGKEWRTRVTKTR